jgi:hypothetical protein
MREINKVKMKMLSLEETEEMRNGLIEKLLGRAMHEGDYDVMKEMDFKTLRGLVGSSDKQLEAFVQNMAATHIKKIYKGYKTKGWYNNGISNLSKLKEFFMALRIQALWRKH